MLMEATNSPTADPGTAGSQSARTSVGSTMPVHGVCPGSAGPARTAAAQKRGCQVHTFVVQAIMQRLKVCLGENPEEGVWTPAACRRGLIDRPDRFARPFGEDAGVTVQAG